MKTGTDPTAKLVNPQDAQTSTIADLLSVTPPAYLPQNARAAPVEDNVYELHATLTAFKLEADNDFHLVLSDSGKTMIAEIPNPYCVGNTSPFFAFISAARDEFSRKYTPSSSYFQHVSQPVDIFGVGFFDPEHGQYGAGVLAGGKTTIELHPVLGITFG